MESILATIFEVDFKILSRVHIDNDIFHRQLPSL